jgi:mono/diheme cytochrome c family protein
MTLVAMAAAGAGDGTWLTKVPEKERTRPNPMASDPNALAGGAKLYKQNCAKCHGEGGQGIAKKPSLTSERVQAATPGEIQWLLKNGSMKNGMPSWGGMPEPQRWQIVSYVKSMAPQKP